MRLAIVLLAVLLLVVLAVAVIGKLQPAPVVTPPPIAVATPSATESTSICFVAASDAIRL